MHMMRMFIPFRPLVFAIVAVVLAGCADRQPAGQWAMDSGVQAMFESGTVLPDHAYYYIGSSGAPDSIIAIDRRFTLRTRVWAEIDLTASKLNEWLQWFRTDHYPPDCEFRGGVILTSDGQRAGFWYSRNIVNLVLLPEPGVIEVYQPHSPSGRTCGQERGGMFLGGML
ncbi:hypothetical protein [Desulfobulbus sp.]|jgi:hypothetical protein|uniref:hypothetical protein n=1 Tax=Desulfobulbus sp. TaxID=895 RepID=UPI002852A572|nr:hypothetical protein [Desulfobulbus sp.]